MLSTNSYGSFDERPEYKAEPACLDLSFLVEIIERLRHRIPKPLSEPAWIKGKEFLVESLDRIPLIRHTQTSLDRVSAVARS